VVDTGITRDIETEDLAGFSVLCDTWSAKAVVRQRMGRAGRTRNGMNIRLFSEHVHEKYMRQWRLASWTVESVAVAILRLRIRLGSEFLEDMTVRKGLKEMLAPPGAGIVTTAFAQLRWSGFLWPGGEASAFSGLLQRPPGPA